MSSQKFDLSKLSNEELLLYKQLLQKTAIDKQWDMLRNPDKHQVNPNYKFVFDAFHEQKYDVEGNLVGGRRGVVLEGSSRSGKTFSVILFLIKLCKDSDKPLTINVVRETYNGHKITLYKDFDAIYTMLGIEDNPFRVLKDIAQVTINKSKIYFLGADNAASAMGNKSDIVYINEAIDVTFEFYKEMVRRNKFFILDYNPRFTEHWIYSSVIPRSDVGFLRTTFLDNPHVDIQSKNEILRLEPFEPNSYEIVGQKELWYNGAPISDENQPPPHPINVKEGTANVMEWMIMGLGLRGAMRGVIFTNVREIDKDEIPYDLGYSYGLDFGFTCLIGDTLVETNKGAVKIKDISKGDYVLTRSGYKRVLNVFNNGQKEVITKKIRIFNTEIEISSTESHHFNINNKWKKYGELQSKDKLYVLSNLTVSNTKDTHTANTKTTISESGKKKVLGTMKDCITQFGNHIMEKYQKGCTFITLTATHLIIALKILCLLLQASMLGCTMYLRNLIKLKKVKNTEIKSSIQQKIGEKEEQKLMQAYLLKLENAAIAVKNTPQQTHIKNIVLPIVKYLFKRKVNKDILKEIVSCAIQYINAINIAKQKVALKNAHILWQSVEGVKDVNKHIATVYDLQVEDVHEYFANGILVHNCDPTALTRNWESDTDIYIEYLSYHPIDNAEDLVNFLEQSGVEKNIPITCDSSDRYTSGNNGTVEMVLALQDYGFEAYKVSKTKGVMYWLNLMRKKRINLIKNKYIEQARTEFENYKIKEIDGKAINQPIDKFNHGIDSARYRFMAFNDTVEVETEWY